MNIVTRGFGYEDLIVTNFIAQAIAHLEEMDDFVGELEEDKDFVGELEEDKDFVGKLDEEDLLILGE